MAMCCERNTAANANADIAGVWQHIQTISSQRVHCKKSNAINQLEAEISRGATEWILNGNGTAVKKPNGILPRSKSQNTRPPQSMCIASLHGGALITSFFTLSNFKRNLLKSMLTSVDTSLHQNKSLCRASIDICLIVSVI